MTEEETWRRVEVLRIGHRPDRDKRITTHVALVSRALGASAIHIDTRDTVLENTVDSVNSRFGGDFRIHTGVSRKKVLRTWSGTIVHLTMYGSPLEDAVKEVPEGEDVLVVVGSEKVPADIYDLAHLNVAVANQPHSEVSALALFLDRLFGGRELDRSFRGGDVLIHPSNVSKNVSGPLEGGPEKGPFEREWPRVPGPDQCMEILTLLGASGPVMVHLKEVRRLGMDMVKASAMNGTLPDLDLDLLEAGLLLHDLGRTRTHSIAHITVGVELARRLGLDERIVGIVHNHIGAGVTREEAPSLGLPGEDHIPVTPEERIVCHADSLTGGSGRRSLHDAVSLLRKKGAEEAAVRMEELHLELERELGIDIDALLTGSEM